MRPRVNVWRLMLLLCGSIAVCSLRLAAQQPERHLAPEAVLEKPFVDWARANAIPLRTVEAGDGFDDLKGVGGIVGEARIVGLGEATHGTREFFQLKHRIIEYLASQKGFTIFSIEANMPEAYRLNDFILRGEGDPKQLIKGMYFWTWNTQEVLDMVLWMREFNRSGKGRIEFTGFDMQTPNVAMQIVKDFVQKQDPGYAHEVTAKYDKVTTMSGQTGPSFGVGTASFPTAAAAGKHIRYTGFIRTENVTEGWAGLWWRVDGEGGKVLAFDNMQNRGATGTTGWKRYEISLTVPKDARNINFGVIHIGGGTAWFDSLAVEVDGVPYTDTSTFDLDFESPTPKGFYTAGNAYQVVLDHTVAHTGKQSLRSTRISSIAEADPSEPSAKEVVSGCASILKHLEGERARLIENAKPEDVDWAIQMARVVYQSAQMKTGEQSRDESMADNIKWIADHNPGAKIVLWAHNGHITYYGGGSYVPMGSYLRKMFGRDYVNFGFHFNEGSFRAYGESRKLEEQTIGPAPDGSLDHALAATGLPLFALDVRNLPRTGPVAEWARQPHASRSIGAVYFGPDAPSTLVNSPVQEMFDAILFVGKTTVARPN